MARRLVNSILYGVVIVKAETAPSSSREWLGPISSGRFDEVSRENRLRFEMPCRKRTSTDADVPPFLIGFVSRSRPSVGRSECILVHDVTRRPSRFDVSVTPTQILGPFDPEIEQTLLCLAR